MSDLKDLTWNPFKVTWVNSVGISLWVENECPYESDLRWVIWSNPIKMIRIDEKWMNRVNRGEMSDLMEMTWNNPMEVTWVNLMGKSLWFENECPYRFDLIDLSEKALCSVEWMSLWEWLGTTLWESPYGRLRVSLSKWLEWTLWESPYQNEWNRWEMNELKWVEWIEVSRMNGWKWTRTTLWEWSYEWIERYPMKVTWCEWKWVSLSKWSESMRNELEWDRISEMRWNEWFDGKARRKSLWVEWRWTDGTDGTDGR